MHNTRLHVVEVDNEPIEYHQCVYSDTVDLIEYLEKIETPGMDK
jgi:hypothetical protein